MLEIKKFNVYNLEEAVIASGMPMSTDTSSITYSDKRAAVLGNAKPGSGHDCFAKGILVTATVKYPLYWTKQFQRYHFADIVSSQSTMHRVTKMNINESCNEWVDQRIVSVIEEKVEQYNYLEANKEDSVYRVLNKESGEIKYVLKNDISDYSDNDYIKVDLDKKDLFMEIISCLPSGFEMEMEIVTNYLQLKTIHQQRRHHKLPDWQVFCDWIESLPKFKEFCLTPKV